MLHSGPQGLASQQRMVILSIVYRPKAGAWVLPGVQHPKKKKKKNYLGFNTQKKKKKKKLADGVSKLREAGCEAAACGWRRCQFLDLETSAYTGSTPQKKSTPKKNKKKTE